ncbi:MAG: hypothetical protein KJ574_01175 [Nanoarchaeota archaeon]|nr:hypothetical protein [Nanoarchaeota archaeon]
MAFVGFEFSKIDVVKNEGVTGKIMINNGVNIKDVSKASLKLSSDKENAVKFGFEYKSDYGKLGSITLGGSVLYLSTSEEVKSILNEWKKDKRVKKDLMGPLINRILAKCNIQTIILSDTVSLPPPVPMPRVKTQ